MVWSRCFQVACCVVILSSNGWLINLIATRRLGLGPNMLALEWIGCIQLFYITITVLALHILHRSTRRAWLITFMVWDLIFVGVCIGMISIYSFAGVPANCGGMTRSNYNPGDAPNNPAPGFTTVRFGPGLFGNYGELDIYCDIPQTDYAMCVLLVFTYILTLILAITRILSYRYTRNTVVSKMVVEAEEKTKKTLSDTSSSSTISANSSLHRTPSSNNSNMPSNPSSPVSVVVPGMGTTINQYPFTLNTNSGGISNGIDIDIEAQTDPRISNGSRGTGGGGGEGISGGPPPYMPSPTSPTSITGLDSSTAASGGDGAGSEGANAGTAGGERSTIPGYGKDQEFPGLER